MHFTQREQQALRDAGVDQDTIEAASDAVVAATDDTKEVVRTVTGGVTPVGMVWTNSIYGYVSMSVPLRQ